MKGDRFDSGPGRPLVTGSDIGAQLRASKPGGALSIPGGEPAKPKTVMITPRSWQREDFVDPCVIVIDEPVTGEVYIHPCGKAEDGSLAYPWAGNNVFKCPSFRPGEPIVLIRPGWYNIYLNQTGTTAIKAHVEDIASYIQRHRASGYLLGFDSTLPGFRVIGSTPADPGSLFVADAGGQIVPNLTPAHTAVTVGIASGTALAANANRKAALFINDSIEDIYLLLGATAVLNQGIRVNAEGGAFEITKANGYRGIVTAIAPAAGCNLLVTQWT